MFTDDFNEDWDSTENQDVFIKKYFGKGKVLSKKAQLASKPLDDCANIHAVKNSKNININHDNKNDHDKLFNTNHVRNKYSLNDQSESKKEKAKRTSDNTSQGPGNIHAAKNSKNITINQDSENDHDDSFNTNHVRNKRSTNNQSESKKKKVKKSSDDSSQDNFDKDYENEIECQEVQIKDYYNSESNSLKAKKKKKKKKNISGEDSSKQMKNTEKLLGESKNTVCEVSHSSIKKGNTFQNKMYKQLQTAKFRYLNEMLYTNAGKDALSYFEQNTDEFQDYHEGYQSQVSKWPINPVDIIIQEIRQMNKQAVIADLGCGEAKIAEVFPNRTVHSFDLIALKDCITACDMANVPLPSNSVDVVVFCLSLMGTNWKDYIKEGHRLLKLDGLLKIAEIESRIEDLQLFIKNIEKCGFSFVNKNVSHKMFVFLNFKKVNRSKKPSKIPDIALKPCLYKKR